ncbi:NAD(P)-binding protein [Xylariaceae sp. FL0594]|nr:NAD(P)-binding protein [Xylariaceae sp. FL0594]
MSTIKNVVLVGATGNLGPAILDGLLNAGFKVTVFTRSESSTQHTFPESVAVKPVDYSSVDSLASTLQGQDALVSTLGPPGLQNQLNLIEAAAKAGVRRFIPSEFGSDTLHPRTSKLPVFADKVVVRQALEKEAAKGTGYLTYTAIITGPFLDWGLKVGFLADAKGKSVTLYDGGERLFSTTTLATIGKAVAAVLRKPEETANRALYVQDTALTARQLKAIAEKVTGGQSWAAKEVSVEDDLLAPAWAELKKEKPDAGKFVVPFILTSIFGEDYGSHFQKLDNELLGLRELTPEEVERVVAAATK